MTIEKLDDANAWVQKLHFEPEIQVRRFEEDMRGIAEVFVQLKSVPYEKQTSSEISSTLENISKSLTKTIEELRHLKVCDGQDLMNFPAKLSVNSAIENAYYELCNEERKTPILSANIVNSSIENMEKFLVFIDRAKKNESKAGNSSSRNYDVKTRGNICKNFVFKYRSTFGHYPTTRADVVEVLEWVFLMADVPVLNAEGCLRTAIENDKNWLGGKDTEIVKGMIVGRGKSI